MNENYQIGYVFIQRNGKVNIMRVTYFKTGTQCDVKTQSNIEFKIIRMRNDQPSLLFYPSMEKDYDMNMNIVQESMLELFGNK